MERIRDGSLRSRCIGLIADREDRGCVGVAREFDLPVTIVLRYPEEDRESYDRRLYAATLECCRLAGVSHTQIFIALMGWMRILSAWFVRQFPRRILNVHPSLLPLFPGARVHEAVLASGATESGMTIHFVDEGLDSGEIIEQKKCSVFSSDTVDTLKARVQELECEWYPKTLQRVDEM